MRVRKAMCVSLGLLVCIAGHSMAEQSQAVACKGKIISADGQPIRNARVVLYHNCSRWGLGNRVAQEAASGPDGSFVFPDPLQYSGASEYSYGRDSFIILAVHPDYALGWCNISRGQEKPDYEVVLTEPQSQAIAVTDHEGNPLAGVRVWPYGIGNRADPEVTFRDTLSLSTDPGIVGGTTGADGKVVVSNLPRTRCSFHATLKGYAQGLAFSSQHTIRLSKGATVSGFVRNEAGEPVKDAIVRFHTNWGMWQFFLAQTDAQGRFRLEDIPAEGWDMSPWGQSANANGIYIITMEHDDYIAAQTQDQFQPGEVVDDFSIEACRGTLIKCRVVEVDTDRPVAGARIQGSNEGGRVDGRSDANGVFTVRVMPGRTSLFFGSPPEGTYVLGDENPPGSHLGLDAQGEEMTVTMKAPAIAGRLTSVRGKVQLPNGTPAADVKIVTGNPERYSTASWTGAGGAYTATNPDGSFELTEVPAGLQLFLYGVAKDSRYVLVETIDSVEDPTVLSAPLVMQPGQIAEAMLTDRQGNPCASMTVNATPMMWGNHIPRAEDRRGTTDAEGRLRISGIVPGMTYFVMDARGSRSESGWWDKYYNDQLILIGPPQQQRRISSLDGIDIDFNLDHAEGKMILVCFWDMQQRPSRNCVLQLAKQAEQLKEEDIAVIAVHAATVGEDTLRVWVKENSVVFPVGMIVGDREQTRAAWGVESLPWLALTDRDHVVQAERFAIYELDDKVRRIEGEAAK
ncbi:MAG: redoxin domain-containing protein [Sedimentisphaerales bacterium]|nr:redoxin domain-containing protein [Sedimentisphaerales bacterium]